MEVRGLLQPGAGPEQAPLHLVSAGMSPVQAPLSWCWACAGLYAHGGCWNESWAGSYGRCWP